MHLNVVEDELKEQSIQILVLRNTRISYKSTTL